MKGIMKILAAAKLVTLSEEEANTQQSEPQPIEAFAGEVIAEAPAPAPEPVHYAASDVAEGKSFEEIFAGAHLPPSPYPAERLLRLLDGLRAMDEGTRKAAVRAMDAADENWTIEDPVIDAQRKIGALEAYRQALDAQMAGNEQAVTADIADLKTAQERAIVEIRKQISELEKLLEREVQKTAEQIAGMESELKARRDAAAREGARISAEMNKLREIPAQFMQPTTNQ